MGVFEDKLFSENKDLDKNLSNDTIISIFKNIESIFCYLADKYVIC